MRLARPDDVERLLPLMEEFNAAEGLSWDGPRTARALRRLLTEPALGFAALAEDDGEPIAYGVVTFNFDLEWGGRDAFVTELYVAPPARGAGLGRALLGELERLAREREALALHLHVRPDNEAAVRLYLRRGFTEVPRRILSKPLGGET